MKSTSIRRAFVPGIAVLALALSACGGDSDSGSDGLSGELAIGGASSQEAAQAAWIVGFNADNPDVNMTYDPVGSGGGREGFVNETFPTAGTDSYLEDSDEGAELTDATERCGGTAPIEIPNYISPIAVIYNLEGVDELNLPAEVLAGIFAGEITNWDDPAIAEANPDATLPAELINPVHRSDESGTTGNFTNYLSVATPDVWTAGEVELWPEEYGGEGAAQTSGVVTQVTDNPNSIGYADASATADNAVANIGVGEDFVAPTPEAAAAILEASPRAEGREPQSLTFDLDYNTDEAGTYPIVLTSYMLACQSYDDETGALAKAYLEYILSDAGQEQGANEAGSAPLSEALLEEARGLVEAIEVPAS